MPATAGRVRMPANNRVHSSAALQTHGIWQSAIGYDPYAPNKDDSKNSAVPKASNNEPDADNPYNSYQGLLALARITNTNADEARGACKKCGRVGHLTFQCRNFLSVKEDTKEKDADAIQPAVMSELDRIKGKVGKMNGKSKGVSGDVSDEDEEEESSDSDADSEMEKIIASRVGKKVSNKGRSSSKKKGDSDESDSDSDSGKRKKRGRSKRSSRMRGHSDSEDEDEGKRRRSREKRRKRDKSSDGENERQYRGSRRKCRKEKRRRRSQRHTNDSDSSASEDSGGRHELKGQRSATPSDFDARGSDDSRVRRSAKRSIKKSQKRPHRNNE